LPFNAEGAENERRGRREGKMGEDDPRILRDLSVFLGDLCVKSVGAWP
jgi:hypothetical protein